MYFEQNLNTKYRQIKKVNHRPEIATRGCEFSYKKVSRAKIAHYSTLFIAKAREKVNFAPLLDFTCSMKIHHSWMIWGPLKIQYNKPNNPLGPSVFLYPSNRMEFGLLLYSKPSLCQSGVAPVDHQLEH